MNFFRYALGAPCALLLAGCGTDSTSVYLTVTGSSTVAPLLSEIAKRFESANPGIRIEVQTGGSSRGIADAIAGRANIGMSSRELKEDEAGLVSHPIAVDGIAVILHQENPVKGLTLQQLADIYTGKIERWSELGGPDREIIVVNKAEGRGTLEVFLKAVSLDSSDISADLIAGENQHAIKTVAGNADAIGYVSIGAAEAEIEGGLAITMPTIDEIPPSADAVASGSFPISRPLLLLVPENTQTEDSAEVEATRSFVAFAKGESVSDIISAQLYVPIIP
ncbi:MAG: phosphate ABC transporter substrate-binding protein [Verrucomicrobiota bacterium]